MKRIATLTGHTYRVLYLAASPDGQTLVTGAGDETLRFWKIFPPAGATSAKKVINKPIAGSLMTSIT
jgi:cell division cycle 20-like protein 1 (cofactor of APC complex)